ncbi:ankyrin repeat-containing domain protein [Baffinella frigidus]|nr:ankyrin repeat-containing domain protein [Cryptophyta sp. CCMP2293]
MEPTPLLREGVLHPLLKAVYREDFAVVRRLLDREGADIEMREPCVGRHSLHIAVQFGMFDMVELLIERGASVSTKSLRGETMLNVACLGGVGPAYNKIIAMLLLHGADVHQRGCLRRTALHTAVLASSSKAVALMLAHGADIEDVDYMGHNALHCAAWRDTSSLGVRKKIARMLLEHGTDFVGKVDALMARTLDLHDPDLHGDDESDIGDAFQFTPAELAEDGIATIMHDAFDLYMDQWTSVKDGLDAQRELRRVNKLTAFAMGHHKRLGVASPVLSLPPDILKMVSQYT